MRLMPNQLTSAAIVSTTTPVINCPAHACPPSNRVSPSAMPLKICTAAVTSMAAPTTRPNIPTTAYSTALRAVSLTLSALVVR